jgi:hypothetical protein
MQHMTDAHYFAELRLGLIVHPTGPGLSDVSDRENAWDDLRGLPRRNWSIRPDPSARALVMRLVSHTPARAAARAGLEQAMRGPDGGDAA